MRIFLFASMILVITSISASAAVLRSIEGGVSVKMDSGYSLAVTPQVLTAGSSVQTAANGSAELVYPNGCIQKIGKNQTVRVLKVATCANQNAPSGVGHGGTTDTPKDYVEKAPDITMLYVLGAVGVGGAVCALAWKDTCLSP
jgi:hypothetical protein